MLAVAFFTIAAQLPAAAGKCATIGAGPPSRLEFVRSPDHLPGTLDPRLSLSGGRLLSIGSKTLLGELYLPLARKGRLKELFLLLPGQDALGDADLEGVRDRLTAAGVSAADRETFRVDDGTIRGKVEGVSVRLFPRNRFSRTDGKEVVLLIDPEFLLAAYRNEVATPIVELAWKLVTTLREKDVRSDDVFLLDLAPMEDASLRYAFLPILLREMIAAPETFRQALPEKWEILQQAENASFFAQYPESMVLYRRYLEVSPNDASACHKIAMAAVRDLDPDLALHWLNRAAKIDPRFRRGFAAAAEYFARRNLFDPAERIFRAAAAEYPSDGSIATSLASLLLMRGERLLETGDREGAKEYFGEVLRVTGADPAIADTARRGIDKAGDPATAGRR